MKGIVVEIKNKDAVVLSDEGNVVKIKNNSYHIGEEVQVRSNKRSKSNIIAIVAGFMIAFAIVGGGTYSYRTPYAYVSLDVNPSIEYSVNIFDKVIEVNGMNEDGEAILSNIDIKNKDIDEAIKETVSEISNQGYIKDGENDEVIISTFSDNGVKAKELADELKIYAEEVVAENNLEVKIESTSVEKERVEEAKRLGVTPGKLNLVEKLQKSSANPDEMVIEEWINKPVKEIMKETKVNKEQEKDLKYKSDTNDNELQKEKVQNKDQQAKKNNGKDKIINNSGNVKKNKDGNNTSFSSEEEKNSSNIASEKKNINANSNENKSENGKGSNEANNKKLNK